MEHFRPQKAPSESIKLEDVVYPCYVSFKLDGIRGTVLSQSMRSTTNTELPTAWAKKYFCIPQLEGVDGELVAANAAPGRVYNDSMSAVMTHGGMEPLTFYAFDLIDELIPYNRRLERLRDICAGVPYVVVLEQRIIHNAEELLEYEEFALAQGYEGLMIRYGSRYYKFGRCTAKEANIFKFVRHVYAEAEIIGFYEQMENTNAKTISGTGHSKRSTHKAGKVGKNTLGGFHCRNLADGVLFDLGTGKGLDAATRKQIWDNQNDYLSMIARYKSKPYGKKDKPRQPIWDGWRARDDMSDIDDGEVGEAF